MAGELQDLFSAFDRFNSGLKQLQLSRTLNNANETVQEIRDSDAESDQKTKALRALGQQVTFNLTGLGVPASQIAGLTETFAPKVQIPQSLFQGLISKDKDTREESLAAAKIIGGLEAEKAAATEIRIRERGEERFERRERVELRKRTIKGLGVFSDSKLKARITKELPDTLTALEGVDELLKFSFQDRFFAGERARAKTVSQILGGAGRLAVIGSGPVTEEDQKRLDKIFRDPTKLFSLPASDKAALKELKVRLRTAAINKIDIAADSLDPEGRFTKRLFGNRPIPGALESLPSALGAPRARTAGAAPAAERTFAEGGAIPLTARERAEGRAAGITPKKSPEIRRSIESLSKDDQLAEKRDLIGREALLDIKETFSVKERDFFIKKIRAGSSESNILKAIRKKRERAEKKKEKRESIERATRFIDLERTRPERDARRLAEERRLLREFEELE